MRSYIHSRTLAVLLSLAVLAGAPGLGQSVMGLQISASPSQTSPVDVTLEILDEMEQIEFTTSTVWTNDKVAFSGVSLKKLLMMYGVTSGKIEMVALNDYSYSIEFDTLEDDAPIVATRMNGETMSIRDKGPFWVVFPYDKDPAYRTEIRYAQSIWQLNRLKVME